MNKHKESINIKSRTSEIIYSSTSEEHSPSQQNKLMVDEKEEEQYREYGYRWLIVLLFCLLSFTNGMMWVIVSPISVTISKGYNVSSGLVSIIPMSYLFMYILVNFPSNWVLDVKGIKKGIVTGAILTLIGAGIRCLVIFNFVFAILGQIFCAIAQPFILNAPTKIAIRWFLPKNRTLMLALLATINIIGTAVGFLLPPLFVTEPADGDVKIIQEQFSTLQYFQFAFSVIPTALIVFFFKEKPPTLPSFCSMIEATDYLDSIKKLFSNKKFWSFNICFGTVMGSFCVYGSLLDNMLHPYDYSSDDVSNLAATMMIVGTVAAGVLGAYIEKTLDYRRVFVALGILGALQSCVLPLALIYFPDEHWLALIIVIVQGLVFIPLLPISFDYSCDVLFPAGEAMITGCLMTSGQIFGILFIVMAQQVFSLGNSDSKSDDQEASLYSTIFIGVVTFFGVGLCVFFKYQLKRSNLDKQHQHDKESLLSQSN